MADSSMSEWLVDLEKGKEEALDPGTAAEMSRSTILGIERLNWGQVGGSAHH
jgi:hypothetical protein